MTAARTTITGRIGVPGRPGLWCHAGQVTATPTLLQVAADDAILSGPVPATIGPDGTVTLDLLHYRDPGVWPQVEAGHATWTLRYSGLRAVVDGQTVVVELPPMPIDPPAGPVDLPTLLPVEVTPGAGTVVTQAPSMAVRSYSAVETSPGITTVRDELTDTVLYEGPGGGPEYVALVSEIYYGQQQIVLLRVDDSSTLLIATEVPLVPEGTPPDEIPDGLTPEMRFPLIIPVMTPESIAAWLENLSAFPEPGNSFWPGWWQRRTETAPGVYTVELIHATTSGVA